MLKGYRIPVRFILVVDEPGGKSENWSQTLMVFAVPSEHTKLSIDQYRFIFKGHDQRLRCAIVEELEYPIDEVVYRIDPDTFLKPYKLDDLRNKLKTDNWTLEPLPPLEN